MRVAACAFLAVLQGSDAAGMSVADAGAPLRRAARVPLDESVSVHGCNMTRGEVFHMNQCQRASLAGTPPELLLLPPDFQFGVATASYQIEGAAREGGRGPSIWDTFSHTAGRTANGDTGDVSVDHYHRWREDTALISALGVQWYRMSVAWPRVMPDGYTVNPEGVAFYRKVVDRLLASDIQPLLTLYHWDLPQALEDLGGWRNESVIVPAFVAYAKAMFREFGAIVKDWVTFNEPASFVFMGLGTGQHAPGRCSDRAMCSEGDSSREPFIAARSVVLAHAHTMHALKAMRGAGGACEGCRLAMVNCLQWSEPMDRSSDTDWRAAEWRMEAEFGIWADPIHFGDWPDVVKGAVGDRLPRFSPAEQDLLRNSSDWIGLNFYTAHFVHSRFDHPNDADTGQYTEPDQPGRDEVTQFLHKQSVAIGAKGGVAWIFATPGGLRNTLNWVADRYGRERTIYVTESGCSSPGESDPGISERRALDDQWRIAFLYEYLRAAAQARLYDRVNVAGYFVWSLLDNYEWAEGYTSRFGIVRVDYEKNLRRLPKASYHWYASVIQDISARLQASEGEGGRTPIGGYAPQLLGGRNGAVAGSPVAALFALCASAIGGGALAASLAARVHCRREVVVPSGRRPGGHVVVGHAHAPLLNDVQAA